MKTYVNMRDSVKSHANRTLTHLGDRFDATPCRRNLPTPLDADFLIQWGFKPTTSLLSHIDRGKPYMIVDLGYGYDRTERFSISINGFHGTAWRDPNVLDRAPRPMYGYSDWRSGEGSKVIICGQLPGDQSLRGQDMDAWMGRAASAASDAFKLPVVKRPHPKMLNPWEKHLWTPLDRELDECYAFVTWTSTAGIQSVLAGVPTIAMHPGSMVYRLSSQDMTLRTPSGREAFVHELAYREWYWKHDDLDALGEYVKECYPMFKDAPLDDPRIKL